MDEEKNRLLCKLLLDLSNGNKKALGVICELIGRNLFLIGNRYFNNIEDIKDAIQTFYCNLITKSSKFKNNKNAYAWLVCVFKNEIKNKLRRNKKEKDYISEIKLNAKVEMAKAPDYLENYLYIQEIFSYLTSYERKLVEMRYIEKHKLDYISKTLHKPESTIRNHLNKIKEKIKNM